MTKRFVSTDDEWCPVVPEDWAYLPLRRLGMVVGGGTPPSDEANWNGDIPFVTPPDLRPVVGASVTATARSLTTDGARSGSAIIPANSILVSIRAPIGYVAHTEMETAFNQGCRALVPNLETDSRYLTYALVAAAQELDAQGRGTTFMELSAAQFAAVRIPVPFRSEQCAIADYLDREIAKIDTLIEEQHQLIEMLIERRVSVLERGVAELPWDTPLRAISHLVQTGPFGSQLQFNEYQPGGIPVINPSHLSGGCIEPDPLVAVSAAKADELRRHALKPGDLVLARRGELGRCAVVTGNEVGYLCGTGSAVIRPRQERVIPDFLALAFGSRRNRDALALESVGATMDNLNTDIVSSLRIPVPDLDVQRHVLANAAGQTAKLDELIVETERFIELSKERRAALITAAVTGQIDVSDQVRERAA